jgi:hypothetical protein
VAYRLSLEINPVQSQEKSFNLLQIKFD